MNFLLDKNRDRLEFVCADCGHIRADREDKSRCAACGQSPARWNCAPVEGPVVEVGRRWAS